MKNIIYSLAVVLLINSCVLSQWQPTGPYGGNMLCVASSGNNVAVSAHASGVFTSSNNGALWTLAKNGITSVFIYDLCYYNNVLYAGTSRGLFFSSNNGVAWLPTVLINKTITSVLINNNYLFAGTSDSGIYISSNSGLNWIQSNSGLTNKTINDLVFYGSYIFAATNAAVFISADNGNSWVQRKWGFCSDPFEVSYLTVVGTNVFAASYWGCSVYKTTNYGINWYSSGTGIPSSYYISYLAANGNYLYAGTSDNAGDYGTGLYISTNNGNSWNLFDNSQIKGIISGICFSGQNFYVCSWNEYIKPFVTGGVFRSTNSGQNFTEISDGIFNISTVTFANIGQNIFTGYDGIYASANSGASWTFINSQSVSRRINTLASSGNNLYAGSEDSTIFYSSNFGTNWTRINMPGVLVPNISALGVSGQNIFAGIYLQSMLISTNHGVNWVSIDTSTLKVFDPMDILVSDQNIFAGFYTGGIIRSTNNGLNWVKINNGITPVGYCMALAKDGQNLYSCYYWGRGIYRSTNNGDSWVKISNEISNRNFRTIAAYDSKIFVGADTAVFYSSNFGTNWIKVNQGFPDYNYQPFITKLHIANGFIYAATNKKSVWRRLLSDFVGIKNISTEMPKNFSLSQNYPNPFNPSTTISFQLPMNNHVTLKIYDVTGREVKVLVNQQMRAGTYEVTFDGSNLNSGVYFYRLISGSYKETKRMLFLK